MFCVVTGGSGSGKSGYGEALLSRAEGEKFYIATMEVFGREAERRVERHRQMRAGKGFITIEKPRGIEEICLADQVCRGHPCAVLLECMSNLAANELFGTAEEMETSAPGSSERRAEAAFLRIQKGILHLKDQCGLLVVVTNEIFSDGIVYGPEIQAYIRLLGRIDAWMAGQADQVTEVVYGIPLHLKGGGLSPVEDLGASRSV